MVGRRITGSRWLVRDRRAARASRGAILFWLLAAFITAESNRDLLRSQPALGMGLTTAGVVVMPGPGGAKRRLGARRDSEATAGEGTQYLMCAAQAAAVLVGLALHAATAVDWVDPVIAVGLAV